MSISQSTSFKIFFDGNIKVVFKHFLRNNITYEGTYFNITARPRFEDIFMRTAGVLYHMYL